MSRNVGFRHLLKDPKMMGLAKRAGALAEMISAADGHVGQLWWHSRLYGSKIENDDKRRQYPRFR
jgi:hypothetical protein